MTGASKGQKSGPWMPEEDQLLYDWQAQFGNKWSVVAQHIPGRTGQQCAQRWRHKVNPDIAHTPWTEEEDALVVSLVDQLGQHWAAIARHLPGRTDQQCLGRWRRRLDPNVCRTEWAPYEDAKLLALHAQLGNQWAQICRVITGRTSQQCRGRYFQLHAKVEDIRPRRPAKTRRPTGKTTAQSAPPPTTDEEEEEEDYRLLTDDDDDDTPPRPPSGYAPAPPPPATQRGAARRTPSFIAQGASRAAAAAAAAALPTSKPLCCSESLNGTDPGSPGSSSGATTSTMRRNRAGRWPATHGKGKGTLAAAGTAEAASASQVAAAVYGDTRLALLESGPLRSGATSYVPTRRGGGGAAISQRAAASDWSDHTLLAYGANAGAGVGALGLCLATPCNLPQAGALLPGMMIHTSLGSSLMRQQGDEEDVPGTCEHPLDLPTAARPNTTRKRSTATVRRPRCPPLLFRTLCRRAPTPPTGDDHHGEDLTQQQQQFPYHLGAGGGSGGSMGFLPLVPSLALGALDMTAFPLSADITTTTTNNGTDPESQRDTMAGGLVTSMAPPASIKRKSSEGPGAGLGSQEQLGLFQARWAGSESTPRTPRPAAMAARLQTAASTLGSGTLGGCQALPGDLLLGSTPVGNGSDDGLTDEHVAAVVLTHMSGHTTPDSIVRMLNSPPAPCDLQAITRDTGLIFSPVLGTQEVAEDVQHHHHHPHHDIPTMQDLNEEDFRPAQGCDASPAGLAQGSPAASLPGGGGGHPASWVLQTPTDQFASPVAERKVGLSGPSDPNHVQRAVQGSQPPVQGQQRDLEAEAVAAGLLSPQDACLSNWSEVPAMSWTSFQEARNELRELQQQRAGTAGAAGSGLLRGGTYSEEPTPVSNHTRSVLRGGSVRDDGGARSDAGGGVHGSNCGSPRGGLLPSSPPLITAAADLQAAFCSQAYGGDENDNPGSWNEQHNDQEQMLRTAARGVVRPQGAYGGGSGGERLNGGQTEQGSKASSAVGTPDARRSVVRGAKAASVQAPQVLLPSRAISVLAGRQPSFPAPPKFGGGGGVSGVAGMTCSSLPSSFGSAHHRPAPGSITNDNNNTGPEGQGAGAMGVARRLDAHTAWQNVYVGAPHLDHSAGPQPQPVTAFAAAALQQHTVHLGFNVLSSVGNAPIEASGAPVQASASGPLAGTAAPLAPRTSVEWPVATSPGGAAPAPNYTIGPGARANKHKESPSKKLRISSEAPFLPHPPIDITNNGGGGDRVVGRADLDRLPTVFAAASGGGGGFGGGAGGSASVGASPSNPHKLTGAYGGTNGPSASLHLRSWSLGGGQPTANHPASGPYSGPSSPSGAGLRRQAGGEQEGGDATYALAAAGVGAGGAAQAAPGAVGSGVATTRRGYMPGYPGYGPVQRNQCQSLLAGFQRVLTPGTTPQHPVPPPRQRTDATPTSRPAPRGTSPKQQHPACITTTTTTASGAQLHPASHPGSAAVSPAASRARSQPDMLAVAAGLHPTATTDTFSPALRRGGSAGSGSGRGAAPADPAASPEGAGDYEDVMLGWPPALAAAAGDAGAPFLAERPASGGSPGGVRPLPAPLSVLDLFSRGAGAARLRQRRGTFGPTHPDSAPDLTSPTTTQHYPHPPPGAQHQLQQQQLGSAAYYQPRPTFASQPGSVGTSPQGGTSPAAAGLQEAGARGCGGGGGTPTTSSHPGRGFIRPPALRTHHLMQSLASRASLQGPAAILALAARPPAAALHPAPQAAQQQQLQTPFSPPPGCSLVHASARDQEEGSGTLDATLVRQWSPTLASQVGRASRASRYVTTLSIGATYLPHETDGGGDWAPPSRSGNLATAMVRGLKTMTSGQAVGSLSPHQSRGNGGPERQFLLDSLCDWGSDQPQQQQGASQDMWTDMQLGSTDTLDGLDGSQPDQLLLAAVPAAAAAVVAGPVDGSAAHGTCPMDVLGPNGEHQPPSATAAQQLTSSHAAVHGPAAGGAGSGNGPSGEARRPLQGQLSAPEQGQADGQQQQQAVAAARPSALARLRALPLPFPYIGRRWGVPEPES